MSCVWWSNLRGRRRRTAMQASHHRCTRANEARNCVGWFQPPRALRRRPIHAREPAGRASPARRCWPGLFLRTSPSRRAECRAHCWPRLFCNGHRRRALDRPNKPSAGRAAATGRAAVANLMLDLFLDLSKLGRDARTPRRAFARTRSQRRLGGVGQRYERIGRGGGAIFAMG